MKRAVAIAALASLTALALAGCGNPSAEKPASTLTEAQRDSVLGESALPGASTVTVACKTVWNIELQGDGAGLRLTRARLYRNEVDSDEFKASLVSIERKDGAGWKRLAWAVLPNVIADDETELKDF